MKRLLVLGAGFLQDFVIKKAVDMGYYVLALDADANAIGFSHSHEHAVINIVDCKACLRYAVNKKIDGVLTAATDYGVITSAYIAKALNIPGLDYEVAKLIRNKYLIRKCLYKNNVDDSSQAYEVTYDTNIEELSKSIIFPVIVKPCDGSGSRGTIKVTNAQDLDGAVNTAIINSATKKAEIESFVEGNEYGVESLVVNNKVYVLGVMKKVMTHPPYYAELGHCMPSGLPFEIEEKVKKATANAINALGINFGSVNCDIIVTPKGKVHIIDIGARMGGNMIGPCIIPYGTGIDYMAAMIKNALGENVDIKALPHKTVATRLLAFDKNKTIEKIPDMALIEKEYDVEIYHHMFDGMTVNAYHTNLDGCGYIVAVDNNLELAQKKADDTYNHIMEKVF